MSLAYETKYSKEKKRDKFHYAEAAILNEDVNLKFVDAKVIDRSELVDVDELSAELPDFAAELFHSPQLGFAKRGAHARRGIIGRGLDLALALFVLVSVAGDAVVLIRGELFSILVLVLLLVGVGIGEPGIVGKQGGRGPVASAKKPSGARKP